MSDTSAPTIAGSDDHTGDGATDGPGDDDGDSATGDADGTGGREGPDLGPCARYLECVMQTTPEVVATVIATYGERGSCWSLPGVTEDNCWTECTALTEALQELFPDASACWECEVDGDCPADAAFCDAATHTCADWECRDGMDCPVEAAYCSDQHTCTDDPFVHCGDRVYCAQALPEGPLYCPRDTAVQPGACSTEGAIGMCVTARGATFIFYAEEYPGEAEELCEAVNGRWMK